MSDDDSRTFSSLKDQIISRNINIENIKKLLEKLQDINYQDKLYPEHTRYNLLYYILQNNKCNPDTKIAIIKLLIEKGINLNYTWTLNSKNYNILLFAIEKKLPIEIIKVLLQTDIDINIIDKNGNSKKFKTVMENGIDINFVDQDNNNALFYAIINKSDIKLIELLIKSGVNINHVNQNKIRLLANDDNQIPYVQLNNNNTKNALYYAIIYKSDIKIIKLLIKSGVNINFVDNSQKNALYYAIAYKPDIKIIELLIKSGIDIRNILPILKNKDIKDNIIQFYKEYLQEYYASLLNDGVEPNIDIGRIITSNLEFIRTVIDDTINEINKYLNDTTNTVPLPTLPTKYSSTGGSSKTKKTHITYENKKKKVYGEDKNRYIIANKKNILLSSIRGKYKYC